MKRREADTLEIILGSLQMEVYSALIHVAGDNQKKIPEAFGWVKEEFDKVHEYIEATLGRSKR